MILDIQMPGLTGFEVIDALGAEACPLVVFSTAYERYALKAFEAAAADYLLKPYDAERFQQVLDKAHPRLVADVTGAAERGEAELLKTLLAQAGAAPLTRLVVKSGEAWVPLRLDRVHRLSAEDKYVRVYSSQGQHLLRQTLKTLEERLDPARFVRVHRSEIVALDAVARMEPWSHGDAMLVLEDGNSVVLSRNHRENFSRGGAVTSDRREPR